MPGTCFKCITNINSFNSHKNVMNIGIVIIPILQMRRVRLRDFKELTFIPCFNLFILLPYTFD